MKTKKEKKPLSKKAKIACMSITIVAGLAVGVGAGFLIGRFAKPATIDLSDLDLSEVIDDNSDLLGKFNKCIEDGKDPVNEFKIHELANISILKFRNLENSYSYGYGKAKTAIELDIRNHFVKRGEKCMEESLSFGNGIVNVRVSQRAYQENDTVVTYAADLADVETPTWKLDQTQYSASEFADTFGKSVDNPFAYIISSKTVLTDTVAEEDPTTSVLTYGDSKVTKTEDGYSIYLDLNTIYSTAKYRKRMISLSNSNIARFFYVHITLSVDNDFNLYKSTIEESYYASMGSVGANTVGTLDTYYYSGESDIPDLNTLTDYSKGRP